MFSSAFSDDVDTVKLLHAYKADVNLADKVTFTFVKENSPYLIFFQPQDGATPLFIATQIDSISVATFLCSIGADVNKADMVTLLLFIYISFYL